MRKRNDEVPIAAALRDCRIFLAPLILCKSIERSAAGFGVGGGIDGLTKAPAINGTVAALRFFFTFTLDRQTYPAN
jgi:hypothetical protein